MSLAFGIRNSWGLGGGLVAVDAIVVNASTGNTLDFNSVLTKVQGIAIVNPTNAVPGITSYAASTYASAGVVSLPSSASFAGDNFDMIVTGPAVGTVVPGGPLQ